MNYFEVVNKENIGKSYEIFIDGWSKGVWKLKKGLFTEEFDFCKEEKSLTGNYYASQLIRMEFEEFMDWSKIPVDTKVLVSKDNEVWFKRYFAKYKDDKVYCFRNGSTSFSADEETDIMAWKYAKLYQE